MNFYKYLITEKVHGKLPKGWTKDSVLKFAKTLGKSPKEHGFFDL